jgi:hypothetical protein
VFPYDSQLLAAVNATPQSMTDVLGILHAIDNTCVEEDGLKWFNGLYLQVTQAVADRVAAGGFADAAWMASLDVQFANLYFSALKSSLEGNATPGCWRVLFDNRGEILVARIQFALAGVNAHINHDLAAAIVQTCQASGTAPGHGSTHYGDFTALNSTLEELTEDAKRTLQVRLLGDVLPPVSHVENTLASWSMSAARENAWLNAGHLWHLRSAPRMSTSFLGMLDGFSTVIGKSLMVPVPMPA